MDAQKYRGTVIGVSALAAVAAAFGIFGVADHDGVAAQQRDVALTASGADAAHEALIAAQVDQDHALFDQQIAWQESIYYWAQRNDLTGLFAVGDGHPASTNLLNGAFTRFSEALVVDQANQQAHWDHLLGVNPTAGDGTYELAIGQALQADFAGSNPGEGISSALSALTDDTSFTGFTSALDALEVQLYQSAFEDVLGVFIPSDLTP